VGDVYFLLLLMMVVVMVVVVAALLFAPSCHAGASVVVATATTCVP
jgi:competence protein ComGC